MTPRDPASVAFTGQGFTNQGYALSVALHVGIVLLGYVSIPFMNRELPINPPLIVDLVPIEDITSAPPKPSEDPLPEPAPVTPPEPQFEEPPPAEMPPPPKFDIAKIEPEAKAKPKPPPPKAKPTPAKTRQDDVAMLQKLLKDMQKNAPKPQAKANDSKATPSNNIAPNISDRASMTELDAIRRHIEGCWRIDPGKEGIENLSAVIKVYIRPDGSVQDAQITDMTRYFADTQFRTFANSARAAVLGCGNIPISKERYDLFKEIEMNFSPQGRIN